GTGTGFGLVELIQAVAPGARMGGAEMSPIWYATAFTTGVLITLGASWLPTRKATRVSPLAALRPDTGIDARTASGRLQLFLGIALVASGIAGLAAAIGSSSVPLMLLGGAATSVGVLVLGPRIVPALISLIGGSAARVMGAPARLAAQNAVRNPRRTAATTASLLIGVTLTTAVLTGLATARSEVDREMDVDHPIDATITAVGGGGVDAEMTRRAGELDDVEEVLEVPGTVGEVDGIAGLTVLAPSPSATLLRSKPMFAAPGPDAIFLPSNLVEGVELTGRVTLTVGDRSRTLTLNTGDDWGEAALIAPQTLAALTDRPSTQALWLRTDASADAKDLGGDLEAIAGGAEVFSTLEKREYVALQLNVLAGAIVGLLGIAIVIALVGIANTLGLSVLERARENALLRALGLTRRQLRVTLAVEAVLLSVVATVMGVTLGVAFAWVGVETMLSQFVDDLSMTLPWGQLALVIVVSAVAGLLACVLPARRAARVTPAAGLTMD
ncbi:MAG TPA: FtsX-like permease family protein, partial [Nocardioides sp.]